MLFSIAAVLELGALFGALIAGTFADRYSRRQSIFVSCGTDYHSHHWCNIPYVLVKLSFALALDYNVRHTL